MMRLSALIMRMLELLVHGVVREVMQRMDSFSFSIMSNYPTVLMNVVMHSALDIWEGACCMYSHTHEPFDCAYMLRCNRVDDISVVLMGCANGLC